jgi:DNA polymerase-3 subunit gamma/tau
MNEAATLRQLWPQVVESLRGSKVTWAILQDANVVGVEGRLLQIGFANSPLRDRFAGSPREDELRAALRQFTGADWKIDALVHPSAGAGLPSASPSAALPPPIAPPPSNTAATTAPPSAVPPSQGAGGGHGQDTSGFSTPPAAAPPPFAQPATAPEEDEPDPDDEDVDDAGPTARDLLVRELGATVLEEKSDAD